MYWLSMGTVRCACGAVADPDWGQCYDCWLGGRLGREQEQADPRIQEHEDEMRRQYEDGLQAQYTTSVWLENLNADNTQLAQPGGE